MTSLPSIIFLAQSPAPAGGGNFLMSFLPMLLLLAGFWFLIIQPQRKKQKEHKQMLDNLQSGDDVLTAGGIYGTITNVKADRFVVKVADSTKIEISKPSITHKVSDSTSESA